MMQVDTCCYFSLYESWFDHLWCSFSRLFYVKRDTRTRMTLHLISVSYNIAFNHDAMTLIVRPLDVLKLSKPRIGSSW